MYKFSEGIEELIINAGQNPAGQALIELTKKTDIKQAMVACSMGILNAESTGNVNYVVHVSEICCAILLEQYRKVATERDALRAELDEAKARLDAISNPDQPIEKSFPA